MVKGEKTTIFKSGGSTVVKIPPNVKVDETYPFKEDTEVYFEIIDESSVIIRKLKKGE